MEIADLYGFTPVEFERLVAELLPGIGFSEAIVVGGHGDKGVDIIGTCNGSKVAVQVKHKTNIALNDIDQFVKKYFADPSTPRSLIYVTSADLPQGVEKLGEQIPAGCTLRFLGRQDVTRLIDKRRADLSRLFEVAKDRLKSQRNQFLFGLVLGLMSVVGGITSMYTIYQQKKEPLNNRITTVENALSTMRDLEVYLTELKKDMAETEKATQIINEKHAKAKELEKLTAAQLEALKGTLQAENWRRTFFNYVLGFLFGVASSFVASVLHAKWLQRQALK